MLFQSPSSSHIGSRPSVCSALVLFAVLCGSSPAQEAATAPSPAPGTGTLSLPDAPNSIDAATLTGTVRDRDGDLVADATVLVTSSPTITRTTTSAADATFAFQGIAPGILTITVTAPGFATWSQHVTLRPGETLEIPKIELAAAEVTTDVQVTVSRQEAAEEEVHEEETQRLAGFFPNFFVSYDWHAAPLDTKQKFELAYRTSFDPSSFIVAAGFAGVEQAQNDYGGYGQGAQGFGKRYGANFADFAIGNVLGGAVFPALLHQDPRYFYKGTGSIRSRTFYALSTAFICRGDNGRWQPNYSSVLGDLASGAISNLYYPASSRSGWSVTFENGLLSAVGDGVGNLVQEFVFRRITPHAPHYSADQP